MDSRPALVRETFDDKRARHRRVRELAAAGHSFEEISKAFQLSTDRVRQIVRRSA